MNTPKVTRAWLAPSLLFHRSTLALLGCYAMLTASAGAAVATWGNNNNFQTQVPVSATNLVAVSGGTIHSLGLRSDGTVVGWGDNFFGQANVSSLSNVIAISAGDIFSLALLSNGTVAVRGTLPPAPNDLTNVTAIAAGWRHGLALKSNGMVVSWGDTNLVPAGLSNVMAIAAGDGNSLALHSNGTLTAWGNPAFGKTTVPAGLSNFVAIAAGKDHCLALRLNGNLVAWGRNEDSQTNVPANVSNVVAVSGGAFHSLAMRADGKVVAWGNDVFNQSFDPGFAGFQQISAGGYHNLGLVGEPSPLITLQPRDQHLPIDKPCALVVMAVGAHPMIYQWRKGTNNLIGSTNNVLILPNIQLGDAGEYSVIIVNSNGSVTSVSATLVPFYEPPAIVVQPQDITVAFGEDPAFSVTTTGSKPFSYQWWFGAAPINGATDRILQFTNVALAQAGEYSVVITNLGGSITSIVARLVVLVGPPVITSPLSAAGIQGEPFFYQIAATNYPNQFAVDYLPLALTLNTNTGIISGTPIEPGVFTSTITAINDYGATNETLTITIGSGAPSITSPLTVLGSENQDLTYQITITGSGVGLSFGAQNLPGGLLLDPVTGLISGKPAFGGTFTSTISASNTWGVTSATLQFNISLPIIGGITLQDVTYEYHPPYLLDFEFTLRDTNGQGIVVSPALLKAICMENTHPGTTLVIHPDDAPDLPTATTLFTNLISETGVFLTRSGGNTGGKVSKTYLVLDFSASVSDPTINGDSNGDGISDAVDFMVQGAQYFVTQQPSSSQVGVYEFHRDDEDPNQVMALTRDKALLNEAIAGIWTNYINWFYAGSRCWDAVSAAIEALGPANPDEQRSVVFISDGQDSSSSATVADIINNATNAGVRVYCIAFGIDADTNTLGQITSSTGGRLFDALSREELFEEFAQITKDVQARYVLRWHSLRRDTNEIAPFFLISYQGYTNRPAAWTWGNNNDYVTNRTERYVTNLVEEIDNNVQPPVTNIVEEIETNNVDEITALWTNPDLGPYVATNYAGTVTEGALRLVLDEEVKPTGISLRTTYIPRFVRQFRFRYRPNWPCTVGLNATNVGEMLYGWSLTETNNPDGSKTLSLRSPNPQSTTTSLPFPGFGPLLTFKFKDMLGSTAEAFALMEVDNSIYTNIIAGGQRFVFETGNITNFVTNLPALTNGTPIPWLMAHGISGNFNAAELADQDGDGVPTWQEYLGNTNPTNAASVFAIRSLSNDIYGRYQITFGTALNRRYRVESSFDLVNWEILDEDIAGTGADMTILDHRYQPWITEVFYRAVVY